MFQQKDDHKGKQKADSRQQNSASIILHQHTMSYTATEHREVVGIQYLSMCQVVDVSSIPPHSLLLQSTLCFSRN
ncbi:hypothetical protein KY290_015430 [Solanum tuberosum]|uniref:Uncharacterized protein n=1 Tax=Solanum tuberosum TaxID=4113 RepID=A0ABQ7VUP1_SOLTU|nr:hypothetical protein KY289_015026 [Solanum tuberosum]KAH0771449.1 hypothetical protein KY290_015430 [Solanum tuberosum]